LVRQRSKCPLQDLNNKAAFDEGLPRGLLGLGRDHLELQRPSDRRSVGKLKQNRNQLWWVTGLLTGYPITSLVRGALKR
jgi:hypothetical protein